MRQINPSAAPGVALAELGQTNFRLSEIVSSPKIKNIPLVTSGKSLAGVAHPSPHEGRFAIVTKRRAGYVMDAFVQRTTGQERTAKSCGPGAAMLAPSLRCFRK
jgi:hypothetical protein